MSPGVALIIVVLLLWGPTALWLVYRSTRSEREAPLFQGVEAERESTGAGAVNTLVIEGGYWVCRSCRSVNRPDSSRCYNCRADRDAGPAMQTAEQVRTRPGPMMAAGAQPTDPERTAAVAPKQSGPGRGALWGPLLAPSPAASSTPVARPSAPPTETRTSLSGPPELEVPVAGTPIVCAYLGTRDDPATRFDFPYAGNRCHAGVPRDAGPAVGARLRQVVSRFSGQGPLAIAVEQQASLCLTTAHVRCPRYLQYAPAAVAIPPAPVAPPRPQAQPEASAPSAPAGPGATSTAVRAGPGSRTDASSRRRPVASQRRGGDLAGPPMTLTYPPRPAATPDPAPARPAPATPRPRSAADRPAADPDDTASPPSRQTKKGAAAPEASTSTQASDAPAATPSAAAKMLPGTTPSTPDAATPRSRARRVAKASGSEPTAEPAPSPRKQPKRNGTRT